MLTLRLRYNIWRKFCFLFLFVFQVFTDDDKYTAMPPGFPKFELEDGEKKFVFRIPKFNQNVMVDPSVNVGRRKSAASCSQLNTGLALLLGITASLHFIFTS